MKEFTCIVCPNSCLITVEEGPDGLVITGNTCKRGEDFARSEYTSPTRMLTSTVKLTGARLPRVPVKTDAEVPKSKVLECQQALTAICVGAPVKCGDVIVKNICGTGADVVATRTMEAL